MLRCVARTRAAIPNAPAAQLYAAAAASSVSPVMAVPPVAVRRRIHSSASLYEKRMVDGTWVSDNTRIIERPSHFNPPAPEPATKKPQRSKELFPEKRPHDKVAPFVNPVSGTHTLKHQRKDIRMQFQLEPVTRTKVKGDAAAGNAKIHDYSNAEVYTRAPWPSYREIVLNQPSRMHVLSPAVLQQMNHLLLNVESNKDISATMVTSHHINTAKRAKDQPLGVDKETGKPRIPYEKTFCAGMDMHAILALAKEQQRNTMVDERQTHLAKYFRSLYTLAWNVGKLRAPVVMAMDGRAVGAGAGFALQSRYRVATENTRISFPQASLGWFPDAGASYVLPRLDGKLGLFFALTGWQVRALDAQRLGFCTHYCESDELHRFGRRMGDSSLTYQFTEDTIEQAFGMFSENGPSFLPMPIHDLHEVLNEIFDAESVEGILVNMVARLDATKKKGSHASKKDLAVAQFVEEMQKRMLASSPTGLKVTFELLRLSQFLPLEKCLKLEFRLAQGLLASLPHPLTAEVFNAPNFAAKTLAQVTPDMLDQLFHENPNEDKELELSYPEKPNPAWYV